MHVYQAIRLSIIGAALLAGCSTLPKSAILPAIDQDLLLKPTSARGTLVVPIQREARAIQTTFVDVDHIQLDLLMDSTSSSRVLSSDLLLMPGPSVSFEGLPAGSATLLLTAFDSASNSIGSVEQSTTVESDKIKHVPMSLKLGDSGFYTSTWRFGGVQGYEDSVQESYVLSNAKFDTPNGIALSPTGDIDSIEVYIADTANNAIRKYDNTYYEIHTLAGGALGSANGTGSAAQFDHPLGLALGADNNVYVADTGNDVIRQITPAGVVTTFASGIGGPRGIAIAASGNIYVSSGTTHQIIKITPARVATVLAGDGSGYVNAVGSGARFNNPTGLALDASESVYVADTGNNAIRKVTTAGVVTTLAGGSAGFLDGSGANAKFQGPLGIARDASGSFLVSDTGNHRIRKLSAGGMVTTAAGSVQGKALGCGGVARFNSPSGIFINTDGYTCVADRDNHQILMLSK